ncbi:inositol monophosphatase family protein [Streptomyces indicus]|uniref:Myo-inositol-1(Or 4)-monophosphatase n=1 Tax=Streptomyces indicus TaxID=417292 RepID=A0A1G8U943_9ACTN|nr:inositol monophosphatase family protein [Streptomyces indicus]SDJ50134.1 myo-inositol-1(or 4)-monophosphatase [Streptomyces indicus]
MIDWTADHDDAEVAVAAARAGADVVRRMYGQDLDRTDKGAGDFATAADLAAERAILDLLRTARPGDAIVGEETGRQGAAGSGREWLVDPLCGTLNYASGTLAVGVNVALREGAAAVADPFTGEVYATDGRRAWCRTGDGEAPLVPTGNADTPLATTGDADTPLVPTGSAVTPLVPTPATHLVDVNLDPPFPSAPAFRAVDLLAHPAFVARFRPRVLSTSLALAWVAAGKRAAYVTDGGDLSGSVHFAAGIALCRAAGCVVTGVDGLPIGRGGKGLVAAADEDTHRALMSMITTSGS